MKSKNYKPDGPKVNLSSIFLDIIKSNDLSLQLMIESCIDFMQVQQQLIFVYFTYNHMQGLVKKFHYKL